MERIDVARIRKAHKMNQFELARRLQVKQSFLSAIENGKSSLPADKREMIGEIFGITDFTPYIIQVPEPPAAKISEDITETELLSQLLNRFHEHAHKSESAHAHEHHEHHERIEALETRNDRLALRNEELSDHLDRLRDENEELRAEVFRLKNLLLDNGVKF